MARNPNYWTASLILFITTHILFFHCPLEASQTLPTYSVEECEKDSIRIESSVDGGTTWTVRGRWFLVGKSAGRFIPFLRSQDQNPYWNDERWGSLIVQRPPRYLLRATLSSQGTRSFCDYVMIALTPCSISAAQFREPIRLSYDEIPITNENSTLFVSLRALQWAGPVPNSTDSEISCPRPSDVFKTSLPIKTSTLMTVRRLVATKAVKTPTLMTQPGWAALQEQKRSSEGSQGEGEAVDGKSSFLQRYWFQIVCFLIGWSILSAFLAPPPGDSAGQAVAQQQ